VLAQQVSADRYLSEMRIWSIHPKYLDSSGLVALWRETLLAKNVLEGKTKGYRNHPQLDRFKNSENPLGAINGYLSVVYEEAVNRHFNFDRSKFRKPKGEVTLTVTNGQLTYEFNHFLGKLKSRKMELYEKLKGTKSIVHHPMFRVVKGSVEKWEIVKLS
jgi:hypothetical protein